MFLSPSYSRPSEVNAARMYQIQDGLMQEIAPNDWVVLGTDILGLGPALSQPLQVSSLFYNEIGVFYPVGASGSNWAEAVLSPCYIAHVFRHVAAVGEI